MLRLTRKAPRLADWRFNRMSVCICIMCREEEHADGRHGQQIVFVEDRKVTFTDFSADNAVTKNSFLVKNWWVQYAGNDVEKAPLIIEEANRTISLKNPDTWSPQLIVELLQQAWLKCRDQEIEAKILRKHGFSFATFRDSGKDKCTQSVYDELHDRIDRFKFSLEFLVAGFDSDGDAHLLHLDSQGTISSYNDLGFWAIGSGAHAALSSLSFHVEHGNLCSYCSCVHNAVYFACEAKFMAETSVQVGKESAFVSIHKRNERHTQFFFHDEVEKIKKTWLKYGAPKPSSKVKNQIFDLMQTSPAKRSASQDSKQDGAQSR